MLKESSSLNLRFKFFPCSLLSSTNGMWIATDFILRFFNHIYVIYNKPRNSGVQRSGKIHPQLGPLNNNVVTSVAVYIEYSKRTKIVMTKLDPDAVTASSDPFISVKILKPRIDSCEEAPLPSKDVIISLCISTVHSWGDKEVGHTPYLSF